LLYKLILDVKSVLISSKESIVVLSPARHLLAVL